MRRALILLALLAPWAAAQQPATSAPGALPNSPLLWDVREGNHPRMGPITVAVPENTSLVSALAGWYRR